MQSKLVNLLCFGQYIGRNEKNQSYSIALDGLTLDVPVSKDQFDNPPQVGAYSLVRGFLSTRDYGGKPVGINLEWRPITDESDWPKDGVLSRFEGLMNIEKDSYGRDGEKTYLLKISAFGFNYQAIMLPEELDRFPTGEHQLLGKLIPDQNYNKQYNVRQTFWKCVPLVVPKVTRKQ